MPVKKAPIHAKSKPLEKAPPPPARLKGKKYALEYWKRITAELVLIRAITSLHLEALEAICRQWHDYIRLSEWCDKNEDKLIVEYDSGHMVEHPNVRQRQTAYSNLTKLWPKFGLTPEGLGRLNKTNPSTSTPKRKNALREFAARKGR